MTRPPADVELRFDRFAVTPGRGDGAAILSALPGLAARGVRKLLLREKALAATPRRELAERLAAACRECAIELWISEEVELAIAVGASGVQLSERSPSPLRVREQAPAVLGLGVSLHRPITRTSAELALCRHAFLGPLFVTPGKPAAAPLGIAAFVQLAARLPLPVYAIGGIGRRELPDLAAAGVQRIAAIRLFFDALPGSPPG